MMRSSAPFRAAARMDGPPDTGTTLYPASPRTRTNNSQTVGSSCTTRMRGTQDTVETAIIEYPHPTRSPLPRPSAKLPIRRRFIVDIVPHGGGAHVAGLRASVVSARRGRLRRSDRVFG